MLTAALLLLSSIGNAKDLRNRLGVGFQRPLGDMPSLSIRYGLPTTNPAINIQTEVDLGVTSDETTTDIFGGGRVLYAVVVEDNMNLYAAGGVGVLSSNGAATVRLQPALEAQVFPFGLENLGVTLGWGLSLDMGDAPGVSTVGSVLAGAHYWF